VSPGATARFTAELGDETLVAHCHSHLSQQAEWLLRLVQSLRDTEKGVRDGTTIQLGWSMITVRRLNSKLVLFEPDFGGDALAAVRPDVTVTLWVLSQQSDLLVKLAVEGVAARFDEKVILATGVLRDTRIYLERTPDVSVGDSGWYIGPVEGEDATDGPLEAIRLYELLKLRPAVMPVLALPPGWLIVFNGDHIEAVLNEQDTRLL
jgi:hypothetical protein